jgi:hypothetical protein
MRNCERPVAPIRCRIQQETAFAPENAAVYTRLGKVPNLALFLDAAELGGTAARYEAGADRLSPLGGACH